MWLPRRGDLVEQRYQMRMRRRTARLARRRRVQVTYARNWPERSPIATKFRNVCTSRPISFLRTVLLREV